MLDCGAIYVIRVCSFAFLFIFENLPGSLFLASCLPPSSSSSHREKHIPFFVPSAESFARARTVQYVCGCLVAWHTAYRSQGTSRMKRSNKMKQNSNWFNSIMERRSLNSTFTWRRCKADAEIFHFLWLFIDVNAIGAGTIIDSTSETSRLNVWLAFGLVEINWQVEFKCNQANRIWMATETSLTFRHNSRFHLNKSKPNDLFLSKTRQTIFIWCVRGCLGVLEMVSDRHIAVHLQEHLPFKLIGCAKYAVIPSTVWNVNAQQLAVGGMGEFW